MTNDTWGPWQEHTPGQPCPIPGARAGAWEYETRNGIVCTALSPSIEYDWGHSLNPSDILRYRVRNPAVDWQALAREAVKELKGLSEFADSAAWSANTSLMDDKIKSAEAFLDRARKAGIE